MIALTCYFLKCSTMFETAYEFSCSFPTNFFVKSWLCITTVVIFITLQVDEEMSTEKTAAQLFSKQNRSDLNSQCSNLWLKQFRSGERGKGNHLIVLMKVKNRGSKWCDHLTIRKRMFIELSRFTIYVPRVTWADNWKFG